MQRLWLFLLDPRFLAALGVLSLAGLLFIGADALRLGMAWVVGALLLIGLVAGGVWGWRRLQARQAARALEQALDGEARQAVRQARRAGSQQVDDMEAVRQRIAQAVQRIKASKLGETSGAAALYELPWYAIIGNPAAGKSSAIVRSGLTFPFAENTDAIVQGIGGTRHCDWYFTTEGILLDTAGRYAVQDEDHREWLGFLRLLKTHRSKAPLNGVIVAVSVAELAHQSSDFAVELAHKLRQRLQELIEQLEVFMPVYVVFTKADLIAGFVDFFEDRDRAERDQVWGATLAVRTDATASAGNDAATLFEHHMDVLYQGLKEASVVRMTLHRGEQLPPGVLTFPLEFMALKPVLRTFVHTLFQDNPYQFRPIFRGFYFTSAVQEGQSTSRASERVAERFGLQMKPGTAAAVFAHSGFFLKELFSQVIFPDRDLVQQHTSRRKLQWRQATFFGGVLLLGVLAAAWTWSWHHNMARVARVQADLRHAHKLQADRLDLQSRLQALEVLQDRLEQVQRERAQTRWTGGWGLDATALIERRLKEEYFHGLQVVLLRPGAQALAAYLVEANAQAVSWAAAPPGGMPVPVATSVPTSGAAPYAQASAHSVSEAYNALKAYLMLGDRSRMEPGHLGDQLTRFWREWLEANRGAMPRAEAVRRAERILGFALGQLNDPDFPQVELDAALLDQTREHLRRVVRGMPARERVYADIKARAATRFPAITVARVLQESDRDLLMGSHVISGAFTREAWEGHVRGAIQEAAHRSLQSTDWVLKTQLTDDLTLEGSPEQVQKALIRLYKDDYVREWQRFVQGIGVGQVVTFEQAHRLVNRLGDPVSSPLGLLLTTLHEQTSWDNPGRLNEQMARGQQGVLGWFKASVLGLAPPVPATVTADVNAPLAQVPMGPVGKAFAGVDRLMRPREGGGTLARQYLDALGRIRGRFNLIRNQGDPGPGARQFMQQTLEGAGELSDGLKLVDEQMLNGLDEAARQALRPVLVRPLMQAFAVLVPAAEAELNKVWAQQVHALYERTLATRYPFDRSSRQEAAPADIAAVFGSEGAVARYLSQSLGALVLRRGDDLQPRTWADMGVRLRPEFVSGLGGWVAPIGGAQAGGAQPGSELGQTAFQVLPQPAPGLTEYAIEIDGQTLRYRQGVADWTPFTWPGPGTPGVRISGVTFDGRSLVFFHEPGRYALEKMIQAAQRKRIQSQHFELRWAQGDLSVPVQLRILSSPASAAATAATPSATAAGGRPEPLPAKVVGLDAAMKLAQEALP